MTGRARIFCFFFAWFASLSITEAQDAVTSAVVVQADRLPHAESPFSIKVIEAEELKRAPQLRLDDILRAQVPGFSLFRRSSSRVANPTTQGVTLRNFGPSGAGRTLVLLDGIPLNDPFAGYVQWNQLPPASIGVVLVNPGGGAGLFGNAALAGTIFVTSKQPQQNSAFAQGLLGNTDTYGLSAGGSFVEIPLVLSVYAERFSTGGYPVLQSDQRGPVDRNATSDSDLLQLGAVLTLDEETSLTFRARGFQEERGNGTVFTRNETTAGDASIVLARKFTEVAADLRLTGYYQHRKYASTFSSINATRDVETPALDQFDVPADAAGGSVVWSMHLAPPHTIAVGADARWIEGETNEAFRFVGNAFTRLRNAGGQQLFIGAFVEDAWKVSPATSVVGGVRLDYWRLFEGARNEFERATHDPTLTSRFRDRDGFSLNGRIGANVDFSSQIAWRAALYSGFRVPTLNELYRPFRVGNVVTEANAELEPERLLGGETGIEWRPSSGVRLAGTLFYNRLEDAIGNVTFGFGPGTFDPGGFIPAGGVLRQRRNIDLVSAPGIEVAGDWQIAAPVFLRASYLFTQPKIESASEPALVGRLLAQTPEHVVTVAAEFRPSAKWLFTAQTRYSGRQFEDDQNAIELAPFFTVDAAVFYELSDKVSAGLKIENVLDAEIETGKSPEGLVSIGAPRLVTLQVQWQL